MTWNKLEQAEGFVDSKGNLGKTIPIGSLLAPREVSLDSTADEISWSFKRTKVVNPDAKLFDGFVGLWKAGPEEILDFARTWGCLLHANSGRIVRLGGTESIAAWRYYSKRIWDVLHLAQHLQRDNLKQRDGIGDWRYWSGIAVKSTDTAPEFNAKLEGHKYGLPCYTIEYTLPWNRLLSQARGVISDEINSWIILGDLRFGVEWRRGPWKLEISFPAGLMGVIALQLALTISGSSGLYFCSNPKCGKPYIRLKKKPKQGWSNYCDTCGKTAANRAAGERRHAKRTRARVLSAEGMSDREIADTLGTKMTTVANWLKG